MGLTLASEFRRFDEPRYRAELYRAWHAAFSAGLPHDAALGAMPKSLSRDVEAFRRALADGTVQGKSVAAVVKANPAAVSSFESSLLTASEAAGTLEQALRALADHFAREFRRALRVRLLMGYPVFAWVIASFVVPLSRLQAGWQGYVTAVGLGVAALFLVGGLPIGIVAGVMLESPPRVGARLARTLTMLLTAGVPRGRAIRGAVEASGSSDLKRLLAKRTERDLNMTPLATLFEGSRAITPDLLSQMRIADVAHDYPQTLGRYADMAEQDER